MVRSWSRRHWVAGRVRCSKRIVRSGGGLASGGEIASRRAASSRRARTCFHGGVLRLKQPQPVDDLAVASTSGGLQLEGKYSSRGVQPRWFRDFVVHMAMLMETRRQLKSLTKGLWETAIHEEYDSLILNETLTNVVCKVRSVSQDFLQYFDIIWFSGLRSLSRSTLGRTGHKAEVR